eukprot:gene15669-17249_t
MDDQRCELPMAGQQKAAIAVNNTSTSKDKKQRIQQQNNSSLKPPSAMQPSVSTENLFDILQRVQGNRIDGQRSQMPDLPGLDPNVRDHLINTEAPATIPDDSFFDMLMRCQATRIEDQRCDFPALPRGPTVPDEDFFNLILKLQSKRINDQRVCAGINVLARGNSSSLNVSSGEQKGEEGRGRMKKGEEEFEEGRRTAGQGEANRRQQLVMLWNEDKIIKAIFTEGMKTMVFEQSLRGEKAAWFPETNEDEKNNLLATLNETKLLKLRFMQEFLLLASLPSSKLDVIHSTTKQDEGVKRKKYTSLSSKKSEKLRKTTRIFKLKQGTRHCNLEVAFTMKTREKTTEPPTTKEKVTEPPTTKDKVTEPPTTEEKVTEPPTTAKY